MAHLQLPNEIEDELAAIAAEAGCELFAVERHGKILRIVLDRLDGAVTLEDCETVSRQASALLDVHDLGLGPYTLEVSSPGLDRPLRGARDYRRFIGSLTRVTFADGNASETVVGRLEAFDESGNGRLVLTEQGSGRQHQIPLGAIRRARLEIEL